MSLTWKIQIETKIVFILTILSIEYQKQFPKTVITCKDQKFKLSTEKKK